MGAGPAGLAAAATASKFAHVTVIDDNPNAGGQIWRASKSKVSNRTARRLLDEIKRANVRFINGAQVFDVSDETALFAETSDGIAEIAYEKLMIATGARERFLPFPGWTLPGVFGAGGLQAMVKGGLDVNAKRVVVAGMGPLLLAVAAYLKLNGAEMICIAEQSSRANINRCARGLWRSPSKLAQAAVLRSKLFQAKFLTDCWITQAYGDGRLERVELMRGNKRWSVECDYVACGFHLVPNTELPRLMGCSLENGFVTVNGFQQTSVENIFCAGEPTGIAGVESAQVEGKIAGLAATGHTADAERLFAQRDKTRKFGIAMDGAFALRDELRSVVRDDTIVCRCEDVRFSSIKNFANFREAKLQTRCGMGPCQGRVCGPATQFLLGWEPPGVRPPIFPVKMEHL